MYQELSGEKALKTQASEKILTKEALEFVAKLHRTFENRRQSLLKARQERQKALNAGAKLDFLPHTDSIRNDMHWHVAATPPDLQCRYVEITGPTDRKMMINALNSGADVYMADFEDANSPTWHNMVDGQANLMMAIDRSLAFTSPENKEYRLNPRTAVLMVRPRGWHLDEKHLLIDGEPVSASLFDFGMAFFHNAKALISKGSGPYFYLPKLESHLEARLWNDVFVHAQEALGIPRGSIRATVLVETILACFEMEEILYELREHAAGLNAGRWDYIFSILKKLGKGTLPLMPDRGQITMQLPFMRDYNVLLIKTCHSRGAHAIGGMAAYIPSRKDAAVNEIALQKVLEDKLRESALGFDGTWVAHPDLVPLAREVFSKALDGCPNQLGIHADSATPPASALLDFRVQDGKITENGMRQNISVVLQYLTSWLNGVGAVAIANLMEDAATAEISCAQLWHWLHFEGATLDDGRRITKDLYMKLTDEETEKYSEKVHTAREVMDKAVLRNERPEFLTLIAYELLN